MPTTLTGLLIFILFLAPGITYSAVRAQRLPERERTVLRETAATVLVSTICLLAALTAFLALRANTDLTTPDVSALVRDSSGYWKHSYAEISWWALGIVAVACVVAALAGWLLPHFDHVHDNTAWFLAFDAGRKQAAQDAGLPAGSVQSLTWVEMDDGSQIGGIAYSYSRDVKELSDRELVLSGDLAFRPNGSTTTTTLDGVSLVVVSASKIKALYVTYQQA